MILYQSPPPCPCRIPHSGIRSIGDGEQRKNKVKAEKGLKRDFLRKLAATTHLKLLILWRTR